MSLKIDPKWDYKQIRRDRRQKLQAEMKERGIGAMYLTDGVNIQFLLCVRIPGASLFVPPDGDIIALVRKRDWGYVELHYDILHPPLHNVSSGAQDETEEGQKRLREGIGDMMAHYGVAGEPLGLDTCRASVPLTFMQAGVKVVDAMPAMETARAVKSADEIEIYRALGKQYAYTVGAFREAIRPGITERELDTVTSSAWFEAGGDEVFQLNVCAGENMNPWRRWATDRPLKDGEFVGIDFHGRSYAGLLGDMSRTFVVGDSWTPEQRDLYRQTYDYMLGTIDTFRAGRTYSEVIDSVPPVPKQYQKVQANYHIGHSTGPTPQSSPKLDEDRRSDKKRLEENQVMAIECFFAEERNPMAVKLEELIIVHDGPAEIVGPGVPFEERLLA
ncbi:MAG TPA: Xaa-Pro peptidase family protein [Chloroflexota bacterium]|nr:Xaa-Pro peptidase family protein [Chloroflexota bacterium]